MEFGEYRRVEDHQDEDLKESWGVGLTGIMSDLTLPLKEANISIFVVSTW
jgi:hypothetical protein